MDTKKYTVVLLFNKNGSKVLLQKKDRTAYAGRLNGVGGKVEEGEQPWDSALREVYEETSIHRKDIRRFSWLGTLTIPEQCDTDNPNVYPELWFFAGIVEDEDLAKKPDTETEEIGWLLLYEWNEPITEETKFEKLKTAGDGNLEYFIGMARRMLFDKS